MMSMKLLWPPTTTACRRLHITSTRVPLSLKSTAKNTSIYNNTKNSAYPMALNQKPAPAQDTSTLDPTEQVHEDGIAGSYMKIPPKKRILLAVYVCLLGTCVCYVADDGSLFPFHKSSRDGPIMRVDHSIGSTSDSDNKGFLRWAMDNFNRELDEFNESRRSRPD